MSVQAGLEFDPSRVPNRGGADTREAPGIFDFNWDATKASAEEAFHDVPGRAGELRGGEIAAAAAELARLNGTRATDYYVNLGGEPVGNVPVVDEQKFWGDLARTRRLRPDALKDLGNDRADYDQRLKARFAQGAQDRAKRMAQGGLAGNLLGGIAGSFSDPINIITLPFGGGGRTVAGSIVREALFNAGIEAAEQPLLAVERGAQGREFSLSEAGSNIVLAGVGGGALTAAGHGIGAALAKLPDAIPLDLRMAMALRQAVPDHAISPDQAAALHVLERGGEIDAANPYQGTATALEAHTAQIDDVLGGLARMPEATASPVALAPARAAAATPAAGVGYDIERYMRSNRSAESSGSDVAKAATSSAYGRYQFLKETWVNSYKATFGETGETRAQILAKRANGSTQDQVMRTYTAANARTLQRAGVPVDNGTLYLAHFLGTRDAIKVLRAADDAPIGGVVRAASIAANSSVFERAGTVGELRAWAARKMGAAVSPGEARVAGAIGDDIDAPIARPAELDAERPTVGVDEDLAEPLQLRRDQFRDDNSWRLAQSAMNAKRYGDAPLVTRQALWTEARDKLMADKSGVVEAALFHPEIGAIDVRWGNKKGGLAHIADKHADVLDDLPEILDGMSIDTARSTENRLHLESPDHVAKVRLDYDGERQRWLLTAFRKDRKASPATEDGGVAGGARDQSPTLEAAANIGDPGPGGNRAIAAQRRGDFFEISGPDAQPVAKALGVAVTRNRAGEPMVGIPAHAFDQWSDDLAAQGIDLIDGDARPTAGEAASPAVQDLAEAEGLAGPVIANPDMARLFDNPDGEGAAALADTLWHDIDAAIAAGAAAGDKIGADLKFDLGDGKGERSLAEIREELDADGADIDTIEACLAPAGGAA